MGNETEIKRKVYLDHYLLEGSSISPDLKHEQNRRSPKAARAGLYESMPAGTTIQVVEGQYFSELSDLLELKSKFSKEKLMKLHPLKTDEDVEHYEASRPREDKSLDPLLRRRLIKHGLYNPGVKVMDFVVLYSLDESNLRLGPVNRAAAEFVDDKRCAEVVPLVSYQDNFKQALAKLETERKKAEPRRVSSMGRESVMPLAAVAAGYER